MNVVAGVMEGEESPMVLRRMMSRPSLYAGRTIVMTTKHRKEALVALPLRLGLGMRVSVAEGIDTDLLGTFTGEVPRDGTPREVAIRKARLGMADGASLGLASEGSFGPDSFAGFITVHHELLCFVDDERGIELCEQVATTKTNFNHVAVSSAGQLAPFLESVRFPSHALIVRPHKPGTQTLIRKAIRTRAELEEAIQAAARWSDDGQASVETDMRAHVNPTRARVIRGLAFRLALRLRRHCPGCDAPGWGQVGVEPGLPCRWCDMPTDLTLHDVYACPICIHEERHRPSDGPIAADPGQCSRCNP